jgi:MinD superfamily P-loop ATPase
VKLTIASGKGGTGKTTLATNLALALSLSGRSTVYLDCDAEEPNGHIFLKPEVESDEDVAVLVPEVDFDACTACGECAKICRFSAIVCLKDKPFLFEQLCHSCGGCMLVCPTGAIKERPRKVGVVRRGRAGAVGFVDGSLDIGAIQTPAVIKAVKRNIKDGVVNIIDCPPGTSCPVIEAVRGSDFVLLVTEPTPFGLNDLKLAVDMVRRLELPFAVAINRCDAGDDAVLRYCCEEAIDVLLQLPNERRIAECYSRGLMLAEQMPEYRQLFLDMFEAIERMVREVKQ